MRVLAVLLLCLAAVSTVAGNPLNLSTLAEVGTTLIRGSSGNDISNTLKVGKIDPDQCLLLQFQTIGNDATEPTPGTVCSTPVETNYVIATSKEAANCLDVTIDPSAFDMSRMSVRQFTGTLTVSAQIWLDLDGKTAGVSIWLSGGCPGEPLHSLETELPEEFEEQFGTIECVDLVQLGGVFDQISANATTEVPDFTTVLDTIRINGGRIRGVALVNGACPLSGAAVAGIVAGAAVGVAALGLGGAALYKSSAAAAAGSTAGGKMAADDNKSFATSRSGSYGGR